MTRKVTVGPRAQGDIVAHSRWLSQPGAGDRARRQLRAIQAAINALQDEPIMWPRSPDHPSYRERAVGGYVVVYRVEPDTSRRETAGDVYVLRVFGPGQDRASGGE